MVLVDDSKEERTHGRLTSSENTFKKTEKNTVKKK